MDGAWIYTVPGPPGNIDPCLRSPRSAPPPFIAPSWEPLETLPKGRLQATRGRLEARGWKRQIPNGLQLVEYPRAAPGPFSSKGGFSEEKKRKEQVYGAFRHEDKEEKLPATS